MQKKAFTLLELIIVIIIIGVLASLALPRMFAMVEYAKSAEAFANLASIRGSVERCYLMQGGEDYTECDSFAKLDIENPAGSPNAHFNYGISATSNNLSYQLIADRNTVGGGGGWGAIIITVTSTSISRYGNGSFSSIK